MPLLVACRCLFKTYNFRALFNVTSICLNFWDEVWWFLLLRLFGLLSSFSLLYSQNFDRYVLQPSSNVSYQTREPTQNLELNPFFNPWRVDSSNSVYHDFVQAFYQMHHVSSCFVWRKSASEWNNPEVAGSIPTTGKITKNTYSSLTLVPGHG